MKTVTLVILCHGSEAVDKCVCVCAERAKVRPSFKNSILRIRILLAMPVCAHTSAD